MICKHIIHLRKSIGLSLTDVEMFEKRWIRHYRPETQTESETEAHIQSSIPMYPSQFSNQGQGKPLLSSIPVSLTSSQIQMAPSQFAVPASPSLPSIPVAPFKTAIQVAPFKSSISVTASQSSVLVAPSQSISPVASSKSPIPLASCQSSVQAPPFKSSLPVVRFSKQRGSSPITTSEAILKSSTPGDLNHLVQRVPTSPFDRTVTSNLSILKTTDFSKDASTPTSCHCHSNTALSPRQSSSSSVLTPKTCTHEATCNSMESSPSSQTVQSSTNDSSVNMTRCSVQNQHSR